MASNSLFHYFLFFSVSIFFFSEASASSDSVILTSNSQIQSPNRTFTLGFFNPNPQTSNSYLGIWYSSIPGPVYVWVANRQSPLKSLSSATLRLTGGRFAVSDSTDSNIWESDNSSPASELKLLDSGNLVLLSPAGDVTWQSFDHPTDTWLPGMNLTAEHSLTSWRSLSDPSPGKFSLRLRSPGYGEVELVASNGSVTVPYWSTGNWSGSTFTSIPQMTIPYIYKFYFADAFTQNASFGFTETALDGWLRPLTRFHLSPAGQLRQHTWSAQTEVWNTFWIQPDNPCRVFGLCGDMGLCYGQSAPGAADFCGCLDGFNPVDESGWAAGDFSGGCKRRTQCGSDDEFEEVGVSVFDDRDGVETASFHRGSRSICVKNCLGNCSCTGFYYNDQTGSCTTLYGSLLNIRNSSSDTSVDDDEVLFIRLGKAEIRSRIRKIPRALLIILISGSALFLVLVILALVLFRMRTIRKRRKEEEAHILSVTNLKMFSYKELHSATRGFSEKLGHGGFGTVFRGVLSDASPVAVKRLERPGGAEREFRAEVCTIGNIQHVNLVRLRGFCSEESHRLLVYDYMPNGALNAYLKKDGQILSWEVRFRVAIGTAKALAYLHEGCRDCIIHCDIKPENILLDSEYTAKVSDFGLAKLVGRDFSRVLVTMRGTWGYVAPEWISGVAITNKADVYSYGMTMLELISGRRNVEGPPGSGGAGGGGEKWFFPPWAARRIVEGDAEAVVDERLGGGYEPDEVARLGMVAVWCIQDEEGARPTMGTVVAMLEGVVEVAVPPPPKLLQALVSGDSFVGVETVGSGGSSVSEAAGLNPDAGKEEVSRPPSSEAIGSFTSSQSEV